ncbi:MAG TPA: HIT family protein [Rhizomicrobium sp.]|nr:HIT family protein [Rhizomicrobium sp.]HSS15081.1 HIT family protein [Rhizomicrobium sp.]
MAYDNGNIFARILRGEIPCVKVFEDASTLAFMDVMPESEGHVLVVPKEPAQDIFDLSADGLTAMMATTRKVARAVDKALGPDGIQLRQYNRAPAGQSIFHVHFHILPIREGVGLAPHGKVMVDAAKLEPIAAKIRSEL